MTDKAEWYAQCAAQDIINRSPSDLWNAYSALDATKRIELFNLWTLIIKQAIVAAHGQSNS